MPVTGAKSGPTATSKAAAGTTKPAAGAAEKGPGGGGRTTFRPPWVKDGPQDEGVKPAWVKRSAADTKNTGSSKENGQTVTTAANAKPATTATTKTVTNAKPAPPTPVKEPVKETRLQSREIKVPVMTPPKPKPVQPALKPVSKKTDTEIDREIEQDIEEQIEREREKRIRFEKPKLRHVEINKDKNFNKSVDVEEAKIRPVLRKTAKVEEAAKPPPQPAEPEFKDKVLRKVTEDEKAKSDSSAPPPPPMPKLSPVPPPPPPPSGLAPPEGFQKKPLSDAQKNTIEKLKQRARRRPDWSEMMKEVEDGKKLKHVECNDRSKPIITKKSITKVGEQFIFETEKENAHNVLLKQIQTGVRLRPTKCNDRSKPILEGLRKFRRQMTIEEQIQKSESRRSVNEAPTEEESGDEMDDIDKLRDDLQSTKQLLQLELRNKEAQERENKRLLAKISNLEAELEREKEKATSGSGGEKAGNSKSSSDDVLVSRLKKDAEDARKTSKELEKKYQDSAEQLDASKGTIEHQKIQIATLEKKLSQALQGIVPSASTRKVSDANQKESSPEIEMESSESDSEEDEEKKAERKAKRLAREVKLLRCKLNRYKDKVSTAKRERASLKDAMKKNQAIMKEETKKLKKLEKEVKKMAKLMECDDDEDEEKDEDDEEEVEEEEETESEEESESEESEDETETETESESEDEDASDEDKKTNLEPRIKKYEGRLAALKKGNYLLQANVDRIQDEINMIREKSVDLQAELDSVLSELG